MVNGITHGVIRGYDSQYLMLPAWQCAANQCLDDIKVAAVSEMTTVVLCSCHIDMLSRHHKAYLKDN